MRPQVTFVAVLLMGVVAAGCLAAEVPLPPPDVNEEPEPRFRLLPDDGINNMKVPAGGEPSILADRDGKALWIGGTRGVFRSADNGTTWARIEAFDQQVSDGYTLAQDDKGRLYTATTNIPYINVHRYDDGETRSWTGLVADAAPVADRPWLAARGDGEVALIHYDFGRTFSESCVRSTDGGVTWLDRAPMMGRPQGGNLVYGPDGGLYYSNSGGVIFKIADGTCSGQVQQYRMFGESSPGSTGMIQVAVDATHAYIAAPKSDNTVITLLGVTNDLQGEPRALTVSPPELRSNTFPVISQDGDELFVVWYGSEKAGDPASFEYNGTWNVYATRVTDFWSDSPTLIHYNVSTTPIHHDVICMGGVGCTGGRQLLDYFGADHDLHGTLHIAYGTDEGTRYARIPKDL